MQLDNTEKWIIALCFGTMLIIIYFWPRFDESSYDSDAEYFARYKPRFSTSFARYTRAKLAYLGIIILTFVTLSLIPELVNIFFAGAGSPPKLIDGAVPVIVALALASAQKAPLVADLEHRIRGFLHSLARIPQRVRRTVAQMRTFQYTFSPQAVACQTRKLNGETGEAIQREIVNRLLADDEVVQAWYVAGCLLFALSEKNRERTQIDTSFFDFYKSELESIVKKHVSLGERVRDYIARHSSGNLSAGSSTAAIDAALLDELRDLRERLYTFIACGVHSSVKNDALSLEVIKRLGFAVTSEGERGTHGIRALAGLSFIALMALSVFTGFTALLFQALVLARVGPVWIEAFPVPTETLGLFTWSWSTAAFYLAAILGALTIRYSRINRREWFDINNLSRERPILLYITPTLVGTAVGWLTLTIIALIGGPAFKVTFGELTVALGQVLRQSLPWLPLATMMSFIAVALSDSRTSDEPFWRGAFGRAACAASAMAVVGFLTGGLSIWTGITAFANKSQPALDISSAVIWTGLWLSLFIAFSIGLFVFVLCLVAQFAERKTGKNLSLAGKAVGATARQQPVFSIVFDETRTASLFDPTQVDLRPAFALCQGEWQLFPEGTAVRWESQPNQDCPYAGSFGLISSYGDSLIYEGFAGRFSGKADFVAQVHERLNGASGAAQVREARRDPREEAMPSTTNPPVERFASVSLNREGVA